jgi:hypothetical protein
MDPLTDWISEIEKKKDEETKKMQSPEYRSGVAFCAHTVSMADARKDLMENPTDPFLFRKWLQLQVEEGPADIRDCRSQRREEIIGDYCGLKVVELLGCKCGNTALRIDPNQDWQYSSGQFNIKARKGPCSVWSGHTGWCWEGTMADGRTAAGLGSPGTGSQRFD